MKVKRFLKRFQGLELSYLPEAPDHRQPELALIRGGRVVPIATGEQAQAWWENPEEIGLSEEYSYPELAALMELLKEHLYYGWIEQDGEFEVKVGEQEESCWGFIGEDAVREAAQEAARRLLEEALEEELERAMKEAA